MTDEELVGLITQAVERRVTTLDLSERALKDLPSEIGQLSGLTKLDLAHNQLTGLPPEIGQLKSLTSLALADNQLSSLPPEVGDLANLRSLDLTFNLLTKLPPEVGELSRLRKLHLAGNALTDLPPVVGQLTSLTSLDLAHQGLTNLPRQIGQLANLATLDLTDNQLAKLPSEIGHLSMMTNLYLQGNQLTDLPPQIGQLTNLATLELGENLLTRLPPETGKLTNLRVLDLHSNQLPQLLPEIGELHRLTELVLWDNRLTELPPEIGQLAKLTILHLDGNQLEKLAGEIGKLTRLTHLYLDGNQLTELPPEIGQLTNLRRLYVDANRLSRVPREIGQLAKLTKLDLARNRLATVPREIGELAKLTILHLESNQLTELPSELGRLSNMWLIGLEDNPITSPAPEIVAQGTQAVVAYFREQLVGSVPQWVSKVLLVGEGGVGKTSVLRALLGEPFDPQLPTTHGVDIRALELAHPTEAAVRMQLNTWDFGGQQIYHATHQFFLTNRSLFLLVWNARHGYEQGKLYHWMETIQALAPDSPVLLVATHIDERDAALPLADLQHSYPQIVGHCEVSSLDNTGIDDLRGTIATVTAGLPLMGEPWPKTWLAAAQAIRSNPKKHITPTELYEVIRAHGVGGGNHTLLAQWLHELGDILFFQQDEDLKDTVILKPQWLSEYISKVLESEEVIALNGIFTRTHMGELWSDLHPGMRDHFLNLMERFDISYRTLETPEISLVVERLPLDPPDYAAPWKAIMQIDPCREITMKFYLSTIPAGIPTWFIARSHRFTTHTHWRNGALFAHGPERQHLALVQAFPHDRYLQLAVRGPSPHNFFALLKDGIELTLRRFPGLHVDRKIPCPGHKGKPCSHEFDYEQLLKRVERRPEIECPESLEDVFVPSLLFGLHWTLSTESIVLSRLDELEATFIEGKDEILTEFNDLRELTQREFTKAFRREQSRIETHSPNIFCLRPRETTDWRKALAGQKVDLQLYCQAPGQWHPTEQGGLYALDEPAEWIAATAPYIGRLISVLKFATPFISPVLGVGFPDYRDIIKNDLDLMNQLVKSLPDLREDLGLRLVKAVDETRDGLEADRAEGAALRALRQLLDQKDPQQHWGGLKKVLTPEGHYLWLCDKHAAVYAL